MFCSIFCTEKCTAVHVGLVRSVLINTTLSKAPDAPKRGYYMTSKRAPPECQDLHSHISVLCSALRIMLKMQQERPRPYEGRMLGEGEGRWK